MTERAASEEKRTLGEVRRTGSVRIPHEYRTLKAAKAAGFHVPSRDEYGGEEIEVKGRVLGRNCKKAESATAWKRRGYSVIAGALPHTAVSGRVANRKRLTWFVYRDDQVEISNPRRAARLSPVSRPSINVMPSGGPVVAPSPLPPPMPLPPPIDDSVSGPRVADLEPEPLISLAIESMHALNRAAKHWRVRGWERDLDAEEDIDLGVQRRDARRGRVYQLKGELLEALVRAGRARVETFLHETDGRTCWRCERRWKRGFWCRNCCDVTGIAEKARVFVVDTGARRFHTYNLPGDLVALATDVKPHDPRQLAREVPDVLLDGRRISDCVMESCIERAIQTLDRERTRPAGA